MQKYNRAFTLIELTVVLLIIALSLTVAFPKITSDSDQHLLLRTNVSRIASIVEYAHQQAACRRLIYFLNIDCKEGKYWVTNHSKEGQDIPVKGQLNLKGKLPDGVKFLGVKLLGLNINFQDKVTIRMSPDGSADPAEIILVCSTGETMSITIDEFSGQIKTCAAD